MYCIWTTTYRTVLSWVTSRPVIRPRLQPMLHHRLGPWFEVLYGLEQHSRRFVESGLAGVRHRLP
jgi:hypothetical protein